MESTIGIYEIRNTKNNKIYIGSSKHVGKRWKQHKYMLRENKHHSIYLQNAWNKYGEDSFDFNLIDTVERIDDLFDVEQEWMDSTKCYISDYGYNMSSNSRYVDSSNVDGVVLTRVLNEYKKEDLVEIKPKITLYSSESNKDYAMQLINGNYGYVDKFEFLQCLHTHYKTYGQKRDYISECKLFYSGMYYEMKDLCKVNYGISEAIVNHNGIDLLCFHNYQTESSQDIFMSKIIEFKFKTTKDVDTLEIYTDDRSYEILLSTNL